MGDSLGIGPVDLEESLEVLVGLGLGPLGGGQVDGQRLLQDRQLFLGLLERQLAERVLDLGVLDRLVDLVAVELDEDVSFLDGRAQLDGPFDDQGARPGLGPDRDLGMLKPCGQLLTDDLRAFAAGAEPTRPFLRGPMQNAVTTGISELLESDGEELNEDFAQALDEVRREREAFVTGLSEFLSECGTRFTLPPDTGGFEEYFERNAPDAVAALAERAGVGPECRRRGADTLLALKSARMWVGAALSLACAQSVEGRAPRAEEMNEVMHAVTGAAAAETFVTTDARALPWLGRIAIDGLRTTDLKGF